LILGELEYFRLFEGNFLMWQAVKNNKFKSVVLIILMGLLMLLLGAVLGASFARTPGGVLFGISSAGVLWFFMTVIAFAEGKNILLAFSGAKEVGHEDAPQLYNLVEEMKLASSLESLPKIYIIESRAPNAFAVGSPKNCAIAVTSGLISTLNRDELQAVIAHEIGHIKNEDTKFLTMTGVMLGTIVILSDIFSRSLFYGNLGGRSRSRSSSRDGGQIQIVIFFVGIILAIIAPFIAQIIYFACSRSREYLADASAAIFTRYPEGLASALEKISSKRDIPLESANRVTAPMYIVPPIGLNGQAFSSLFSTHPPTEERIKILRSMSSGGLAGYNDAFKKLKGNGVVPDASGPSEGQLKLRGLNQNSNEMKGSPREAGDILMRAAKFKFVNCECGIRLKAPPGFTGNNVICPRCGKTIKI